MSDSMKSDRRPGTGRYPGRVFGIVLLVVASASLVADLLIDHHGKFGIDGTIGFSAWFGALSCIVFAAAAWLFGQLLGRPDDYYDR